MDAVRPRRLRGARSTAATRLTVTAMTPGKRIPAWRRYVTFWRSNIAEDVDDELAFHVDMRIEEYVARGMTEEEARRAVIARLGDVDAAKAECIDLGRLRETHARNADFFDGLRSDIQYALRSLARAPGWTAVALLTIALGVGATTTVFSVADRLLVRQIPYRDASRVYVARRQFVIHESLAGAPMAIAAVREWRTNARTIEAAEPFRTVNGRLGSGAEAVAVHGAAIDTGFLNFAGVHPLIGRNFSADEIAPNGPGAVMLAEPFWRRQFGASRDVIGKVVQLGGRPRTIVGVTPASLTIPDFRSDPADIYVPLVPAPNVYVNGVIVRLKRGVSPKVATEELKAIFTRAHLDVPPVIMNVKVDLELTRPGDGLRIRQALVMLTGAVALLLLVACTNVAHLLLARGAARQRELAVRHALGAGRSRLLRQLTTESVVLAVIGGTLAIFVGWAGLKLLAAARPADLVELAHVSGGSTIPMIAAVLAIACGLAIGLLAALRSAHRELGAALRVGASSTPRAGRRLRSSLVVGEVALSATLLVGALLLIHTVFGLQRTRVGFDTRGLYAISFPLADGASGVGVAEYGSTLRTRAAQIPGVRGVTFAGNAPQPHYFRMLSVLETPERPAQPGATESTALTNVAPDYFSVLGMPLLSGRTFDEGSVTRNEAIVSASLAKQLWPNENPIGRRLRNTASRPPLEPWLTVVGVVPDVVADLLEGTVRPGLYRPLGPMIANSMDGGTITMIVRMSGDNAAATLKQFATSMQPNRPGVVENVRAMIDESVAGPRFFMRILVVFAAIGARCPRHRRAQRCRAHGDRLVRRHLVQRGSTHTRDRRADDVWRNARVDRASRGGRRNSSRNDRCWTRAPRRRGCHASHSELALRRIAPRSVCIWSRRRVVDPDRDRRVRRADVARDLCRSSCGCSGGVR